MDNGMISVSMMCVHLGQIKEYLDALSATISNISI